MSKTSFGNSQDDSEPKNGNFTPRDIGPCKGGSRDSGFKFQTDQGFLIQISKRARFRIQNSKRARFRIQISTFWDSIFKAIFWDSYFKMAWIQDSNSKQVGFRIQIWAYRALLIQVLPVPNAYTKSSDACIHYAKSFCYLVYALRSNCNKDAYMHEQTSKGFGKMNICITRFGIRIGYRKYLNEYMPFGSVSLWTFPGVQIKGQKFQLIRLSGTSKRWWTSKSVRKVFRRKRPHKAIWIIMVAQAQQL